MKNIARMMVLLLLAGCSSRAVTPAPEAVNESGIDQSEAKVSIIATAKPNQSFIITTGVHGDEPSGARLQPELEKLGYNVFGPCNPWGLANNKRHLKDGQDLNRVFGSDDVPEAQAVKAFLKDNPPKFLLDLHEDPNGEACYLIVNGPDDEIGRQVVAALKDDWNFAPEVDMWGVKGTDGVLQPSYQQLQFQAFAKIYSLAFYAWKTYGCTAIVVECPGSWPMEKKKKFHLAVIKTAEKLIELD